MQFLLHFFVIIFVNKEGPTCGRFPCDMSDSSAAYGRYGQNRENGRKFNLLLYVKVEPSTADMAKTVKTAVNLSCFCM